MKVEVVSIGNELLMGDILDTNAAHITRCLDEIKVQVVCKVTVGDDASVIAGTLETALQRADVVISTGGMGTDGNDQTCAALAEMTGRKVLSNPPRVEGAVILGTPGQPAHGLRVEADAGVVVTLPGNHRHMAYLLETEVLPFLQKQIHKDGNAGWLLLRTAGLMESTLIQQLSHVALEEGQRLTFASFAGQTDIRLWAEADSPEAFQASLGRLQEAVQAQLGDHIYGQGEDRLEDAVAQHLAETGVRVAVAECHTGQALTEALKSVPGAENAARFVPATTQVGLAAFLNVEPLALNSDLTRWCRLAAERLCERAHTELGLVVYNNVTRSGVQILVTLASEQGVTAMQRSFGGHPGNISQWASTLALVHLRRWLLAHYPQTK